jgi:oligopeptide/dipeptide ABC transporter ATP-binding protein
MQQDAQTPVQENANGKLVEVKDLRTYFYLDEGVVRAVDGVDFDIYRGKTLGIVGESGCGKSVTAQSILRIVPRPPGRIVSGSITLARRGGLPPVDLAQLSPKGQEIRSIRGREISMIFQEPMNSLSPVHTIGFQIIEAILLHQHGITKEQARERAIDMLRRVGIAKPDQRVDEYSYQLSGGMRQRAMIAIALSCNPALLVADEPTTALDVTVQAQILLLIKRLQEEYGMAIMLITHDLGVISEIADDVVVMYFGRVVERTDVYTIFRNPLHPYTQALLRSIPSADKKTRERLAYIEGSVPEPFVVVRGCSFADRCNKRIDGTCTEDPEPELREVEPGHFVRCVLYGDQRKEA